MLNKLVALTASLTIAASGLASARVVYPNQPFANPYQAAVRPDRKGPAIKAGIVTSTGSIVAGTGYSVSHDGTGEYTLEVPAGHFKSCPVVIVTPAGLNGHAPIPDDYNYITCGGNGEVKIQIRINSRTSGSLQDNSFHFLMMDT
jgi:hypothetical protein